MTDIIILLCIIGALLLSFGAVYIGVTTEPNKHTYIHHIHDDK